MDAALSPGDALQAAPILPAKHFGLFERGTIEPGKRANLVLLAENPVDDLRAIHSLKRVWCAGVQVDLLNITGVSPLLEAV